MRATLVEWHTRGQWTEAGLLLNCSRTANLLAHHELGTHDANVTNLAHGRAGC